MKTVGPLVVLATWPGLSAGSLWIHFIDNAAAHASYVGGSSSVASGDDTVGLTWEMAAHQPVIPCFDRVHSAVDELSGSVDMSGSEECRRC